MAARDMRALTVKHPWAWAIARGPKRIENRSWAPSWRGRLFIHAGLARPTREDVRLCARWAGGVLPREVQAWCDDTAGCLVATAELVDVAPPEVHVDDHWALPGYCHWILRDVEPIEPVPCRGRLGLWWVPGWIAHDALSAQIRPLDAHRTARLLADAGS